MLRSYQEFINFLENLNNRPRLLLHSCCAPCSSYTISLLVKYFEVTVFYSNDNIYPYEEYLHRYSEQKKFIDVFNSQIEILVDEYEGNDYYQAIKGFEDLKEGSQRCYQCYLLRLQKTALKAKQMGFDYFTTTLSISPHKNSEWLNEIGFDLEEKYQIPYLYSNFKKQEGYKKSLALAKEYDLYRQHYCGCVYSLKEAGEKE